ncbi:MAG: hypothetical protein J5I93_24535 [Pirellulaceae bacterium]|nr:hypothetical protein [Pirellulaceae bacterium]
MKIVEKSEATGTLAEYASNIQNGAVIVTDHGSPVAALVPIQNADVETVTLSTNEQFINLIERSRSRAQTEGGISSQELRKRLKASTEAVAEQTHAPEPPIRDV